MHKFELPTVDGKPLGTVELQRPDWPIDSVIYRGGAAPDQRIVGHHDAEEGGRPVLVVEEI
jgi:hypothetical protein